MRPTCHNPWTPARLATVIAIITAGLTLIPASRTPGQTHTPQSGGDTWVEATLKSMSLDDKVGQLIIPATVGMFLSQGSDQFKEIQRNITEFHVGGYHVLGDPSRLHEPAGVALLINHMQALARVPLMITADFEG